jgi:hypothetical protein
MKVEIMMMKMKKKILMMMVDLIKFIKYKSFAFLRL